MAPRPVQADGGNHPASSRYTDAPAGATGPVFVVSREDVLAKHRALVAEATDFQQFLAGVKEDLVMTPCGGDPVSHDVARGVNYRFIDDQNKNSYWNVCQQWVDNLRHTADSLAAIARQYGYTDEDIASSLKGSASSA